ncbi:MAG: hypothetical protein WCD51_13595 [Anaerolineae bacterium]
MPAQSAGSISLSPAMDLSVGTLMLEDTPLAVTETQADQLLPLWQMLGALQGSGTSSELEVEAVLSQIEGVMTAEQLAAIEEMDQGEMQAALQEVGTGAESGTETGETGGAALPPEAMAAGEGLGMAGMSPDSLTGVGPQGEAPAMTEGTGSGSEVAQTDAVVELLETRSTES